MKQNFFDQLDGGWDKLISDVYEKTFDRKIISLKNNKQIDYVIDYKAMGSIVDNLHVYLDKTYIPSVFLDTYIKSYDSINIQTIKAYNGAEFVYGYINYKDIFFKYKEREDFLLNTIKFHDVFEDNQEFKIFDFVKNDRSFLLTLYPLTNYGKKEVSYGGSYLVYTICIDYRYETGELLLYDRDTNKEIDIDINLLEFIGNNIRQNNLIETFIAYNTLLKEYKKKYL